MRVQRPRGSHSPRAAALLRSVAFSCAVALLLILSLPLRAYAAPGVDLPIDTPAEAHAAILASGAPLTNFSELHSDMIGASQYYEVQGAPGGAATWMVIYTYGWGDCQAGCISRHTFIYQVDPTTGEVTLLRQEGEALPGDAPDALQSFAARIGDTALISPISTTAPAPSDQPGTDDADWAALYQTWHDEFVAGLAPCPPGADPADPNLTTCLLPDGSVAGPEPLFAPAPRPADSGASQDGAGWTNESPVIILALLLAWIAGAAAVGVRKSRAK